MRINSTGFTRRGFAKFCIRTGVGTLALLSGCSRIICGQPENKLNADGDAVGLAEEYDYIVVGSGAGGGPLAANLATRGYSVLLMEAGGDDQSDNYSVPLFHTKASEDPQFRWDFFVRHYGDDKQSRRDKKFCEAQDGIFYPRSGTLGGCTAHNAMIMVTPNNSDWDYIAKVTGDNSWSSDKMRAYFERLENCDYSHVADQNLSRHGFNGWLHTDIPGVKLLKMWKYRHRLRSDMQLRKGVFKAAIEVLNPKIKTVTDYIDRLLQLRNKHWLLDPNDWRNTDREGLVVVPMTTHNGRRVGSREYIRQVERQCAGVLRVQLHALVTRVIFDGEVAVGVEYRQGKGLYNADRSKITDNGSLNEESEDNDLQQVRARREVILSGGVFNTPQLLMLSGVGPGNELGKHGIELIVDSPWVGKNLQDRYEVCVVSRMKHDFTFLEDATFRSPSSGEVPDPMYTEWQEGEGLYTTNGAVISFLKRASSVAEDEPPDLFVFGMPGNFSGYYPGYAEKATQDNKHFTWAILKAHTNNTAGEVTLKSANPRAVPAINFHYFDEGNDPAGTDLSSVVEALKFVRRINAKSEQYIAEEELPGREVRTDTQIEEFVKNNAWGHHASCSCRMGTNDPQNAVVDSRFRVNGVKNLRIVDASVFPKIPGVFIVSAVYMISEKASDVIHEDALRADQMPQNQQVSEA